MQLFFRLIAILLVLTTGGVFQTLAFAGDEFATCAGEEEDGDTCTDCVLDCGLCQCCPLRGAPGGHGPEAVVSRPMLEAMSFIPDDEPILSGMGAEIFQPPRG
ncbi:hypothetical protein ACLESD_01130 [Pyxidicoccus sp. 3LFB2]